MAMHGITQLLNSRSYPLERLNCLMQECAERRILILDIGGEGRYPDAWNLNPSAVKTLGPDRGQPIPRRIAGRAEAIPLPDKSVDKIIVERSPLRVAALHEIARVIANGGVIILRHAPLPNYDPHAIATRILPGSVNSRIWRLGSHEFQETEFRLPPSSRSLRMNDMTGSTRFTNRSRRLRGRGWLPRTHRCDLRCTFEMSKER